MGVLSKGSQVWIAHGTPLVLTKMDCIKEFTWGDDSMGETDDTCLDDDSPVKTSTYTSVTPGEGSTAIDTDPENDTHIMLLSLAQDKERVEIYMGWSDGVGEPTLTGDVVTLPPTRTWSSAIAQLRKNPVTVAIDALNRHSIPFKRRTEVLEVFRVGA
ncbi:phage tail tube protein [Acinetobacter sp. KS-LM10]|uniref:phage tail tube protein n=1 Tax=Acinetobacter sp. KS-LM10 TaxID=3120518 RepID=UPI0030D4A6DE